METKRAKDLQKFLRANPDAWQFAWKSHEDYLLTRLGLLNFMVSAFEMGSQALEKILKSYILFKDCAFKISNISHKIDKCLEIAIEKGLVVSDITKNIAVHFNEIYKRRYPDNKCQVNSLCTKELVSVDESVFEIWDNFKNLNSDYYYVSGILTPAYSYFSNPNNFLSQRNFNTLTINNNAYIKRKNEIESEITKRLKNQKIEPVNT